MTQAWHIKSESEALAELRTNSREGLSQEEVERRRTTFGKNAFEAAKRRGPWKILAEQFANSLVLVLLAAALVALFLGEPQDSLAILAIVLLNGVLGFVQDYRAEKAMEELQSLVAPRARVRRLGQVVTIPSIELVPGDIVVLEAGNVVPADLRLVESAELGVDESTLTGESTPVRKKIGALRSETAVVADQKNMAFKGTTVSSGRGTGVVVRTGMETELGKIAKLLREEVEVATPLQTKIAGFSKNIAFLVVALCVVIFIVGYLRGEAPVLMFLTALSLAVAAIPEALPAVITLTLALGARVMGKQKALVRKLSAVEALGSVTSICSDKTGTLTENRMEAEVVRPAYPEVRTIMYRMLALSNDATVGAGSVLQGDPTETALLSAAITAGFPKADLETEYPRIAEIPFSSERAMMTTIHRHGDELFIFSKGAPEKVMKACKTRHDEVLVEADALAAEGYRVLAFAYARSSATPEVLDLGRVERDLEFVGLVGLIDPPRAEAKEAIALCRSAGIRPVMITGDHPETAKAIARKLGLPVDGGGGVLTGAELAKLAEGDLSGRVAETSVYARVGPEQKIRIVAALQARGEVVAMTGDGVNDAPALKRANIGVAMGKAGTDVAREASHLILLDDNFATIVTAVKEGRRIYDNIRKFLRFSLSGNSGELWTLFLAPFLSLPTPLLPIQILWINLVTDGLPGLALAFEPGERDVMMRPPRDPRENLFARGLWQHSLWVGLLTGGATLATISFAHGAGNPHWQTMGFTVLGLIQMGHVLAIRSERASLFTIGVFSNLYVFGAVIVTIGLQLMCLYVPVLNELLKTTPLTGRELAVCCAVSTVVFIAVELEKWIYRRRTNG